MKGLKVKPSEYDSFIKINTPEMAEAVKGQFYEFFCYNELIQNYDNIKIVKSNYVERKTDGNFIHSTDGKIIYFSRGLFIAEFDVLGIKDDTIYWWEITRTKRTEKKNKGIKRKMALLDRIFENYKKKFCLIIPVDTGRNLSFDNIIIPEPDYENYFNNGYFKFNKRIKDCISLNEFEKISSDYDYIDDLIVNSYNYFYTKNIEVIEKLKNNYIIERVYDINEIIKGKFMYFDIKHDTNGWIEIIDKKIFMDGRQLYKLGAIRHEILSLLYRLKYVIQ